MWSVVELPHHPRQSRGLDGRKIICLGKALPYQSIGILIGAALPRRTGMGWMGEVNIAFQDAGNRLMIGEFAAIVRGQRENPMFDGGRISDQRPPRHTRRSIGQDVNAHKPRGPIHHAQHNRGIVFTIDRVQLPIAEPGSLPDRRRCPIDARLGMQPRLSLLP